MTPFLALRGFAKFPLHGTLPAAIYRSTTISTTTPTATLLHQGIRPWKAIPKTNTPPSRPAWIDWLKSTGASSEFLRIWITTPKRTFSRPNANISASVSVAVLADHRHWRAAQVSATDGPDGHKVTGWHPEGGSRQNSRHSPKADGPQRSGRPGS